MLAIKAEKQPDQLHRGYVRRTIEPAFGAMPPAKVSAQVLDEFYADFGAADAARVGVPSAFD